jgi:hypothetical protein
MIFLTLRNHESGFRQVPEKGRIPKCLVEAFGILLVVDSAVCDNQFSVSTHIASLFNKMNRVKQPPFYTFARFLSNIKPRQNNSGEA